MQKLILKYYNKFKSLNSALLDQGIVSGSNFLLNILLARFLGVNEFGVFTLLWMVVLFASSIQMSLILSPMLSVSSLVIKENKKKFWDTMLFHQVCFCFLSLILIILLGYIACHLNESWNNITIYLIPLALASFFVQFQDFVRRYFYAINKIKLVLITDLIRYVMIFPMIFILNFYNKLNILNLLWIIVIASFLGSLFILQLVKKFSISKYVLIRNSKRTWKIGKWLTGSALLQWLTGNLFFIVSGSVLGVTSVGVLKAAQSILGVTHIILQAFENFMPIQAANKLKKSGEIFFSYIKRTMIYGGMSVLIMGLVISINPNWFFQSIFGKSFIGYGYILQLYSLIYVITFIAFPLRIGLRAIEYTKPIFLSYILTAVITLIIVYPIIRHFNILGAVIGILITVTLNTIFLFFSFRFKLKELFGANFLNK